ncbi:MAG: DUF6495 family protein, partial [Chitinophagales bacterium]
MKFRRLTYEELEERTSQFIQFLAKNTIDTPQWGELLQTNPEHACQLVDDFSDLVMEHKLNQIDYLEQRTKTDLKVYKLLKTKAVFIHLQIEKGTDLNLCRYASVGKLLTNFDANMWSAIRLTISEYHYETERAQEIFRMMESE